MRRGVFLILAAVVVVGLVVGSVEAGSKAKEVEEKVNKLCGSRTRRDYDPRGKDIPMTGPKRLGSGQPAPENGPYHAVCDCHAYAESDPDFDVAKCSQYKGLMCTQFAEHLHAFLPIRESDRLTGDQNFAYFDEFCGKSHVVKNMGPTGRILCENLVGAFVNNARAYNRRPTYGQPGQNSRVTHPKITVTPMCEMMNSAKIFQNLFEPMSGARTSGYYVGLAATQYCEKLGCALSGERRLPQLYKGADWTCEKCSNKLHACLEDASLEAYQDREATAGTTGARNAVGAWDDEQAERCGAVFEDKLAGFSDPASPLYFTAIDGGLPATQRWTAAKGVLKLRALWLQSQNLVEPSDSLMDALCRELSSSCVRGASAAQSVQQVREARGMSGLPDRDADDGDIELPSVGSSAVYDKNGDRAAAAGGDGDDGGAPDPDPDYTTYGPEYAIARDYVTGARMADRFANKGAGLACGACAKRMLELHVSNDQCNFPGDEEKRRQRERAANPQAGPQPQLRRRIDSSETEESMACARAIGAKGAMRRYLQQTDKYNESAEEVAMGVCTKLFDCHPADEFKK